MSIDDNGKGNKKGYSSLPDSKAKNPAKTTIEEDLIKRIMRIVRRMKWPCCEILPIDFHQKTVYNKTKIRDISRFFDRPERTVSVWISRCLKVLFKHPEIKAGLTLLYAMITILGYEY